MNCKSSRRVVDWRALTFATALRYFDLVSLNAKLDAAHCELTVRAHFYDVASYAETAQIAYSVSPPSVSTTDCGPYLARLPKTKY